MERESMSPDDRPESSSVAAAAQPLEWRFAQVFGERAAGEDVQEGNNKYNTTRREPLRLGPVPSRPREIWSVRCVPERFSGAMRFVATGVRGSPGVPWAGRGGGVPMGHGRLLRWLGC